MEGHFKIPSEGVENFSPSLTCGEGQGDGKSTGGRRREGEAEFPRWREQREIIKHFASCLIIFCN